VRESLRPAHFVPESTRVAVFAYEMQTEKFPWAIVGSTSTAEPRGSSLGDLSIYLSERFNDEYDLPDPEVERLGDDVLRLPGRSRDRDVNELLGVDLPREDGPVGGLVFRHLGHVPIEGECLHVDGLEFWRPSVVQGLRIGVRLLITRVGPPVGEAASASAAERGE